MLECNIATDILKSWTLYQIWTRFKIIMAVCLKCQNSLEICTLIYTSNTLKYDLSSIVTLLKSQNSMQNNKYSPRNSYKLYGNQY